MKKLFGWFWKTCAVFFALIVLLTIIGAIVGPSKDAPSTAATTVLVTATSTTVTVVRAVNTAVPTEVPTAVSTDTPEPTDTPMPAPTAVPTESTLLDVQGGTNKNTDVFVTDGSPFEVAWNAQSDDPSSEMVSIMLMNDKGELMEDVTTINGNGQDSSTMHDDCSSGCYLDIIDANSDWHVVVFGYKG